MRSGAKRQAAQDQAGQDDAGALALPRLTSGGIDTAQKLYRAVPVRVRLAGVDLEFTWQFVDLQVKPALAVVLSLGGHRYTLRLSDPTALPALVPIRLEGLPEVSRKVLLAGLLEPLAARLEKSLGIALQVESVEPVAEWGGDGAPRFTIADVAQLPGIGVIGTVEAEKEQDWAFWQHLFGAWPLRSDSEQPLPDLVKLRCILGRTRMPLAELRGIPLGSLLLIEERTAGEGAVGVILATEGQQQRVFRGQAKGSRIEIVSEEPQRKPAAEPPGMREAQLQVAAAGTHDARLQNIEELSVSVEFDLGEQTAALHVLKQVRPGFVFKLTQPVEQASVRIQANGQTIGYGQLIAVGEVLGVRVTAFLQDGS